MSNIEKIDPNLKTNHLFNEPGIKYYSVFSAPFSLYGFYEPEKQSAFTRLPEEVAKATNDGVAALYRNTAGGRVRFKTSSKYVVVSAVLPDVCRFPHMPLSGTTGFDLYLNNKGKSVYHGSLTPPVDLKDSFESIQRFNSEAVRDITINFPLYNSVSELYIGLDENAVLEQGDEYIDIKPILYYGSSITQGGCASRPGNSYQAVISRKLNCDYINLGFSGNARGEKAIADYMSGLDVSLFVCDYDHNAPNYTHLADTYPYLYKIFREKKPNLPIIFISKPDIRLKSEEDIKRRDVIYQNYSRAIAAGDRNIYFIDGYSLFGDDGHDDCTVDGCHPTDLGFRRMADSIGGLIETILF